MQTSAWMRGRWGAFVTRANKSRRCSAPLAWLCLAAACTPEADTPKAAVGDEMQTTAPAQPADPDEGLIAYYPFDGTAEDASGNGHDAIVEGAAPAAARDGDAAGAYQLDVNTRIALDASTFERLGDFTLSSWLRIQKFNEGRDAFNAILSVASQTQDNELLFGFASNDTLTGYANQFFVAINASMGGAIETRAFEPSTALKDGEWHCVALVRRGSRAELYLDGSRLPGEALAVPSNAVQVAMGGVILGQEQDELGGGFEQNQSLLGSLDDLYLYGRAQTAAEVSRTCAR